MDIDRESKFGFDGSIANNTFSYSEVDVTVPHCKLKDVGRITHAYK
ncbi:MAG: hypothetical protein LBD60_04755 [Puniceicoccales bacterium]|nr:hypothetical protein [Puniceicoccales bacterium]